MREVRCTYWKSCYSQGCVHYKPHKPFTVSNEGYDCREDDKCTETDGPVNCDDWDEKRDNG